MFKHEGMPSEFGGSIIPTAVAVDKDKNSQFAVKWAIDKLKLTNNELILVHVRTHCTSDSPGVPKEGRDPTKAELQQFFLPYRSMCARKGIRAKEVVIHDLEVAEGLSEYISANHITTIILGASNYGALIRAFKSPDVPTSVGKCAPDSCEVYVVSKTKVVKLKSSNETIAPSSTTSCTQRNESSPDTAHSTRFYPRESWKSEFSDASSADGNSQPRISSFSYITSPQNPADSSSVHQRITTREMPHFNSNDFLHQAAHSASISTFEPVDYCSSQGLSHYSGDSDPEFRHATPSDRYPGCVSATQQNMQKLSLQVRMNESNPPNYGSRSSENSDALSFLSDISLDIVDHSRASDSSRSSAGSQTADIEEELRRLKHEIKQVTATYNLACQEALTAREKARNMVQSVSEERKPEEAALAIIEREKKKCKAALELANKAQRVAELEAEKRKLAEMKFKQEVEEKQKAMDALARSEIRYRKYTKEEIVVATNYFSVADKIGEGGYGPVFKATLDHTPVAIKVLGPDISQGDKQFQRELEVLSCMRHPHMVILLGACPEYGSLVYEYMDNGSLDDRLFCKNGTHPISWSMRFRIAAEIATALNFLHRTKPEPLVHRDLKPANILLDRNYVSKISDVGLSRLVPPSAADNITQYHMTAAAGTFCYIDPEYQQTGMLGTKSDVYSLGVMLLQIITAQPPMGITHHVENAIETGRFAEILDPMVHDWPVEEALSLAKLALKCCELRKKDRPDLDTVILPELVRLSDLGSKSMHDGRHIYTHSLSQRSSNGR